MFHVRPDVSCILGYLQEKKSNKTSGLAAGGKQESARQFNNPFYMVKFVFTEMMFVNLQSRKAVNFDENGGVMQIHLIFGANTGEYRKFLCALKVEPNTV